MTINEIKPYQKRSFVPNDANMADVAQVSRLYEILQQRPLANAQDLERWIGDRGELESVLSQVGSLLYIRMTCQTDDAAIAQAYSHFIEHVASAVKPLNDQLNHKYLKAIEHISLDQKFYAVHDRAIKQDIALFVKENVPLQTQVELLSQQYQAICGAMTVVFDGKEHTMPQMSKYLLEQDRALRQRAWEAVSQRRLQDKDKLDKLFDQMFQLRNQMAVNAGCSNFIEYQFKNYHRFDYTPQDCRRYHQTVEQWVVPIQKEILKERAKEMNLKLLRPWDTAVDPTGQKPLKPFQDVDHLIEGTSRIFKKLDRDLHAQFDMMRTNGLLDLASRKGKAPGGYQTTLSEARVPFIFMNAVGVDDDVRTLLHESGHAFHAIAAAPLSLYDYRHAPMEFCEVASMAMELIAGEHIGEFYNSDDVRRSNREHLEGVIHILCWVATVDAFQRWLYEHPTHSPMERRQAWTGFFRQFGTEMVDWQGLMDVQGYLWHRQLHVFEVPFYYIEYGIAQLGAIGVWLNSKTDPTKALGDYKKALALGGSVPLPELYKTAGVPFDFSEKAIKPLMERVYQEWKALKAC